jgi:hypothetical protein
MTRLINPAPQFLDGNGDPYSDGLIYFYESGTNTPKNTYADATEATLNTNPVKLDAAGRLPNVWYTGLARVVLKTVDNVQVWERDEVGSGGAFENFGEWQSFILYDVNDYTYRNGLLYRSITNANQGNDPASSPSNNLNWEEVRFLATYTQIKTYGVGDVVRTTDGALWRSMVANNINNNPSVDDGSNWKEAIGFEKLPITFDEAGSVSEVRINSPLSLVGGMGARSIGGTLDWNHITNARSGSGYSLLRGTTSANAPEPSGEYYHPFSFEYDSKDGTGDLTQMAIPYSVGSFYWRKRTAGVWSAWQEFYTTATPNVYHARIASSATLTKQASYSEYTVDNGSSPTLTLPTGYANNDVIVIKKQRTAGVVTVTSASGSIFYPDGTGGGSATVPDGVAMTFTLVNVGGAWVISVQG